MAAGKADLQRDRILSAAQACFIEDGFHSASMASIASTAEMSAGLIYRYFSSKNEIIVAIIERQLALLRAEIAELQGPCDLAEVLADNFGNRCARRAHGLSPALFLEMSAEATRDATVAAALHEFDIALRADLCAWLQRSHGCAKGDASAQALALQCFVEGLRVREAREPDLDRDALKAALDVFVPALLGRDCNAD